MSFFVFLGFVSTLAHCTFVYQHSQCVHILMLLNYYYIAITIIICSTMKGSNLWLCRGHNSKILVQGVSETDSELARRSSENKKSLFV